MAAWDRKPEESSRAYAAFCHYRDLGKGRSLLTAYRQGSGNGQAKATSGQWTGWHAAHGWHARAEKYDAWLEAEARHREEQEQIKRRAEMLRRHRQAGELLTRRGIERLTKKEVDNTRDAISAIKTGIEVERQAEGLPTWVVRILNADPDELRSLLADIEGRLAAGEGSDSPETSGDRAALAVNGKH